MTTTLVGHLNMDQLQQSLDYFTKSKPLSDDIMWEIDIVHMKNRLPIFSSDRVGKAILPEESHNSYLLIKK